MDSRGRPRRRRRSASVAWEMAFEAEVRQLPDRQQAKLLRWMRRWRRSTKPSPAEYGSARGRSIKPSTLGRWPRRIFWVMDPTGGWYPLI
jgi:hypothetical protein